MRSSDDRVVRENDRLLAEHAGAWARVAVANVLRPYPHAEMTFVRGPEDVVLPHRERHPAFYGSYDWHSAVHMHWLLVRLVRRAAGHLDERAVRAVLDAHLSAGAMAREAEWLRGRPGFAFPYGQAWLVRLAAECAAAGAEGVPGAAGWAAAVRPAAEAACAAFTARLAKATYPVRHGTHGNSAFALGLLLDAAPGLGPVAREAAGRAAEAVRRWFGGDRDGPAAFEPSGEDFLSPVLTEADAMRRVLPGPEFAAWLGGFLPGLGVAGRAGPLTPPVVSDRSDPLIGHLLGLHLSRAAALRSIAAALPAGDARVPVLRAGAEEHVRGAWPFLTTGEFATDHWLATFAALALEAGCP